jgi:hypothetical protein
MPASADPGNRDCARGGAERSTSGISGPRDGMKRRASNTIGACLPCMHFVKKM